MGPAGIWVRTHGSRWLGVGKHVVGRHWDRWHGGHRHGDRGHGAVTLGLLAWGPQYATPAPFLHRVCTVCCCRSELPDDDRMQARCRVSGRKRRSMRSARGHVDYRGQLYDLERD